ncbi:MAG: hypothetical protein H6765_01610 [Candidatus Peribacteria bacterium]|nr:MAG: hypothetical protein H6765_01610 [Candidatus Peribacteria bacterium]
MISPNATIEIKPAYTIESIVYNYRYYPATVPPQGVEESFISLPYHT